MIDEIKCSNFVLICMALMINSTACDDKSEQYSNYLFAGSDQLTILANIPAFSNKESNKFEVKSPGLFTRLKDVFRLMISSSKMEEALLSPEIGLPEGTYHCEGGKCHQVKDDKIEHNYEQIKRDAANTVLLGQNELTAPANGIEIIKFVDPPPILADINENKGAIIEALEDGYKVKEAENKRRKEKKKRQQQQQRP